MHDTDLEEEERDYGPSRGEQRRQALAVLELAQRLVERSDADLARMPLDDDLRELALATKRITAQIVVERDPRQVGVAALDQPLRQFQHGQRLPALLAAARAVIVFFLFQVRVVHRGPSIDSSARIRP